jgi:hypothetical protein
MSLNDNVKNSASQAFDRFRESSLYAKGQDRFENLSPAGQKLALIGLAASLIFLLLYVPFSNFTASHIELSQFEEKRSLIRELFKTYRDSSSNQNVAVPPNPGMLRTSIESVLTRAELLPEQKMGVIPGAAEGRLIPQNLVGEVVFVNLAKLNLKQIVDIGAGIAAISSSVKMKDISIRANAQDTRYFDVTYKLYTLNVPEPVVELPEPEAKIQPRARDSSENQESNE